MISMVNHRTDSEIGAGVFNHSVGNAVGWVPARIINHEMKDAAPSINQVVCNLGEYSKEDDLARTLGLFRYPGRVLGSTNPEDIIQLHPDLKSEWDYITKHYERIGLHHAKEVIWNDDFEVMKEFPGHTPSVFYFGPRAHKARPDEKWHRIANVMNSKNNFVQACKDLNIQIPKTAIFDSAVDFHDPGFKFPVFLKISVSVSGLGVVKCEDSKILETEASKIEPDVPFQIQEAVDAISFINLQYEVDKLNGTLRRLAATEQILEGCSHAGNRFPSSHAPWKFIEPLATAMLQNGMKGVFAFDLAVVGNNGSSNFYAIECNPRFNGSTYPTKIAKKMNIETWFARSYKTRFDSLSEIDLGEIEFNENSGKGVIIVNWGCVLDNKLGCLIACSQEEERFFEDKLLKVIG